MQFSSLNKKHILTIPAFFLFLSQTLLLIYYPYLSFHNVFSLGLCLSILILAFIVSLSSPPPEHSALNWLLLFLLFTTLGFWNSNINYAYEERTIIFLTQFAFFYLSAKLLTSRGEQNIFLALILSASIIEGLYSIIQFLYINPSLLNLVNDNNKIFEISAFQTQIFKHRLIANDINGTFTNSNLLASLLMLGSIALFNKLKENTKKTTLVNLFLLIPLAASLLAKSMGVFILFASAIFILQFINNKKTTLLFILSLFLLFILSPLYPGKFVAFFPHSFQSRIDYLNVCYKILRENLIFGAGFGSFADQYLKVADFTNEITRYAHNYVMQFASENGLFAGVGLFALITVGLLGQKKESVNENFVIKDKVRFFTYLFLFVIFLTLSFPPFTFIPFEYTVLFNTSLLLLQTGIFFLILKSIHSNTSSDKILTVFGIIIFIQSFFELTLDKLCFAVIFFGILGMKISSVDFLINIISKRISLILFRITLTAGIIIIGALTFSNYYSNQAQDYLRNNDFNKALKSLGTASKITPFKNDTLNLLLLIRFKTNILDENQIKEIINEYNILFDNNIASSDTMYSLAQICHTNLKLYNFLLDEGLKAINKAITKSPNNQHQLYLKAKLLEEAGQIKEAKNLYQEILNRHQNKGYNYILTLNNSELEEIKKRLSLD
ncbi:MAG: hypothetical protein ACD_79C00420G0002 [uncultured bacterium]|nr:MAG: hypothetical protein ACD_79C00420G0002 [uncultured bacterium]